MSSESSEATRRIMDRIGEKSRIPVIGIPREELYFVAAMGLVALVLANSVQVGKFRWAIIVFAVVFGLLLVYASPSHKTTPKWVMDGLRYLKRPNRTFAASEESPTGQRNEGGLANVTPFEPDERTQDLTHIQRAYPGSGAVLRDDGVMEAFVEIEAANMDFATAEDWASRQRAGQEFINKRLQGDVKFHATTESFDIDAAVERLEERLSDPDVRDRPTLQALLTEYRERRPEEMRERGTQRVRYFVGVSVAESTVVESNQHERSPLEKLSQVPLLGLLLNPLVTRSGDLSDRERHDEMLQDLDDRVYAVRNNFVQDVRGVSARRLSTVELFTLNARFWNGRGQIDEDDVESVIDEPVVGEPARREGGGGT